MSKMDEEKRKNIQELLELIDSKNPNEVGDMLKDIENMDITDDHKEAMFFVIENFHRLPRKGKDHLLLCAKRGAWVPTYGVSGELLRALGF